MSVADPLMEPLQNTRAATGEAETVRLAAAASATTTATQAT